MNFLYAENTKYMELFRLSEQTEQLLEKELSGIHASKTDDPSVTSVMKQYDNIIVIKALTFQLMLRNGFHCIDQSGWLKIELPDETFAMQKDILEQVLGKEYTEVVSPALTAERAAGVGNYTMNDSVKEKIQEEYRKEIENELREKVINQLEIELRPLVMEQIKKEHEVSIKEELREELKDIAKSELKEDLKETVKTELKEDMQYQVKNELKTDMKAEVKTDIRKKIEEEVREKETENIAEEVKQKMEQEMKENDSFIKEQLIKSNDIVQIQENQMVYAKHELTFTENGEAFKKIECMIIPTSFDIMAGNRTACYAIAVVKNDIGKPTIFKPIDMSTKAITIETGIPQVTVNFITKWGERGQFISTAFLNTQNKTIKMVNKADIVQPDVFDIEQYYTEFKQVFEYEDKRVSFFAIPVQDMNNENGYCPIVVHMITKTQDAYVYTDKPLKFNCGPLGIIQISGSWENGIFRKRMEKVEE